MRCDMCGASQAKTKSIIYRGNKMRACIDGGRINTLTGQKITCYDTYGNKGA